MAESEEELKSLLMKMKEESQKRWLKTQYSKNKDHGIRCHHFMANRWGNSGNSDRLYFGGTPKSLQMVDCSHEIKIFLLLGRKAMTNLDSILKSRDITLPTKVCVLKTMVFPVVMYPGSKYRSTSGLSPREHLERQAEFHASTQDEA